MRQVRAESKDLPVPPVPETAPGPPWPPAWMKRNPPPLKAPKAPPVTTTTAKPVSNAVSGSRPIKRRRTRQELVRLRQALHDLLEADHPMTVRQVFYRAVSAGLVAKTEAAYKNDVGRLLVQMRR